MRSSWVGVPRSRSITGAVIITMLPDLRAQSPAAPVRPAANYPLVTYVGDGIASAMAQAKAAAGASYVLVQGAYTAQRAVEAGVLDELRIHQIPVLFGRGRGLFEVLPARVELEIVQGDRHAGRHPHPLPHPPLSRAEARNISFDFGGA